MLQRGPAGRRWRPNSEPLVSGCTRKIICSTNVAETSVTVPDVTVVIDTCRERRNQVDRHSNTPVLRCLALERMPSK